MYHSRSVEIRPKNAWLLAVNEMRGRREMAAMGEMEVFVSSSK